MSGWSDPLYRPRTEFPTDARILPFAGVACGVVVTDTDPDTPQAQWMDDREVALFVLEDVGPVELRPLLTEFLLHAASLADRSTSAEIHLASRDIDRARVAREVGFTPSSVLAVADLARPATALPTVQADVTVRDAQPADADVVARLWHAQADYEGRIGSLRDSDAIRRAIAASVSGYLEGPTTVLLAEHDDTVSGVVLAESTENSTWVGARLALAPVSYLAMASTDPSARGGGVGSTLVAALHARHRASGIRLIGLHYSPFNPLSVPFWSQQGYRPVLTHFARSVG
ncbi:MAG: GNAT family N-acetyltransferase [Jatrophihabitans sp.]